MILDVLDPELVMMEYKRLMDWLDTTVRHVPHELLEDIKYHFREDIDSKRTFRRIDSISSLIKVLETRDCLSSEEVEPLKYIVSRLELAEPNVPIQHHQVPRDVLSGNPPVQSAPRILPALPFDPITQIHDLISSEIGSKWKSLARNLGVNEGSIDMLDRFHCPINEKVLEVLRYYKERADSGHWKYDLMKALRDSRRSDLAERVQYVLGRHGL